MTLVLAFSVQGIAGALTLTETSPEVQSKRMGSTFEISFTVGLTSDTIAYNDASPRRRVTDGNTFGAEATAVREPTATSAIRIDSAGYQVTTVSGTERRLLPSNPTLMPTGGTAVLNTPHPSYKTDTSGILVTQAPLAVPSYFVDGSGNVYNRNGQAVYILTGDGDRNITPQVPYKYTRAKADPNVLGENPVNPVPVERRFDYNEEMISITSTNITIKDKSDGQLIVLATELTGNMDENSRFGKLQRTVALICEPTAIGTYVITIADATPERGCSEVRCRKNSCPHYIHTSCNAGYYRYRH